VNTNVLDMRRIQSVKGEIWLPGSKSLSNRHLLMAAMAKGTTRLSNLLVSEDTERMLDALTRLGIHVALDQEQNTCVVKGLGGKFQAQAAPTQLFLGNAGTAIRPLTAALALTEGEFLIDGDDAMRERPIGPLVDALRQLGVHITYPVREGYPPLALSGGAFDHDTTELDGSLSSQYLTALLMALPLADKDTVIHIRGELVSLPYIDMTLAVLARYGLKVRHEDYRTFFVEGQQTPISPGEMLVEGDASSASYFMAAAAIRGEVTVRGVGTSSLQGDVAFSDVIEAMGAEVERGPDYIFVKSGSALRGVDLDLNHIPDAAMTLATLALFAEGTTRIRNIYNWRIKETDRMTAMATELRKVGALVDTTDDSITITPQSAPRRAQIATYGDHRIAMCFSLLAMSDAGVMIENPAVTAKTFPGYWAALDSIAESQR